MIIGSSLWRFSYLCHLIIKKIENTYSVLYFLTANSAYTHTHIYIYIYMCVCVWYDKITLRLRPSRSNYTPLAIWAINWRFEYDLCDQVAICLRSERIATDLCARESTDGDLCDHGDQLGTNLRSINALGDLGALWRSHRSSRIAA